MLILKDRPSTALKVDKKKQLTPLAVYVEIHIYNTKGERFYSFQLSNEVSKFTIHGIKLNAS